MDVTSPAIIHLHKAPAFARVPIRHTTINNVHSCCTASCFCAWKLCFHLLNAPLVWVHLVSCHYASKPHPHSNVQRVSCVSECSTMDVTSPAIIHLHKTPALARVPLRHTTIISQWTDLYLRCLELPSVHSVFDYNCSQHCSHLWENITFHRTSVYVGPIAVSKQRETIPLRKPFLHHTLCTLVEVYRFCFPLH